MLTFSVLGTLAFLAMVVVVTRLMDREEDEN